MIGSGNLPPCCLYRSFTRAKMSLITQWSCRAWPWGGSTWSFHCAQRPLLTNEPSFSLQCVVGSMKTSVLPLAATVRGACQNSVLVVGRGSIPTSHLRLASACCTWLTSGPMLAAVMPDRIRPSIFPLSAWSKIDIHDEFCPGLGTKWNANSLALVAASPYHALSVLTMNLR